METKSYKEKISGEIERMKKILNNKNAVMKLGMVLVIAGFLIGWAAGRIETYTTEGAKLIFQTGTIFMYAGIILIAYYVLRFMDISKKSESEKTEDIVAEIEKSTETEKQTV